MLVFGWPGFKQNPVEQSEREKQIAFVARAAINVAKTLTSIQIANGIEFNPKAWHKFKGWQW